MQWVKDPKVEHGLKNLGVDYEVVQIPIGQFDQEEGLRRQVRLSGGGRLVEDWVYKFALDMLEDGAAFPYVIAQKVPGHKDRYFVWSGNHRLAGALEAGVPTVGAYLVNVRDSRLVAVLPRVVNAWEGHALTEEESVQNAQWLVENQGVSVTDAAKMFGLKPERLYQRRRAEDTKRKLAALGVSAGNFPRNLLLEFAKLDNVNAARAAAALIAEEKVRGNEAIQIVTDVRKEQTEARMLAEVERWRKSLADRRRPTRAKAKLPYGMKNRVVGLRYLTGLSKFCDSHDTLAQAQLDDEATVKVVKVHAKKIIAWLAKNLNGLGGGW